jgi:hypothetical protein
LVLNVGGVLVTTTALTPSSSASSGKTSSALALCLALALLLLLLLLLPVAERILLASATRHVTTTSGDWKS